MQCRTERIGTTQTRVRSNRHRSPHTAHRYPSTNSRGKGGPIRKIRLTHAPTDAWALDQLVVTAAEQYERFDAEFSWLSCAVSLTHVENPPARREVEPLNQIVE